MFNSWHLLTYLLTYWISY